MSDYQFNSPPLLDRLREFTKNSKAIILAVLIGLTLFSSVFTIGAEEVGVITIFGKYSRQVNPGLNFKIPFAEKVYKVPVERQQKLEFGFRTTDADVKSSFSRSKAAQEESLMLTGDLNLASVEWVVQYRIDNAYNYLFKVRNPELTLRAISESAMRQIVGNRTVNEVITVGRTEIGGQLESLIQEICREYSMGVHIDQVVLQDVNPPTPVKPAFNAVNEAQQEKETLINKARSEYNKVIPRASGQAEETIQRAEGYATERINHAKGEAYRFDAIYKEYIKAPEVTKRRIYLETLSEVLPSLGNVIITDQKGNVLPLLQMQLDKQKNQ